METKHVEDLESGLRGGFAGSVDGGREEKK